MKPTHLTISAFGPFAEKVDIPFAKLGEGGLFLVSGDTGAGKTTIFDAICFALFGEASGSNRSIDSVRSDFAAPGTKTYVALEFLHKGEVYRILRNPAYRRPKKSGEGMTTENAEAALFCGDETLATGFVQVKKAVEALLSVDAKQFKQIAMIAQGEFLKLLYAESSERGTIFRKVFHTDLFAAFQQRLKEAEKEARAHLEDREKRLLYALKQLSSGEALEGKQGIYQAADVLEKEEALFTAEQKEFIRIKEERAGLSNHMQELTSHISRGEWNNKRIAELEEAKKEFSLLLEQKEAKTEKQSFLLKQRTALDYVAPLANALQREQEGLEETETQNEAFTKRLHILQPVLQALEEEQKKQEAEQPKLNEERIRLRQLEKDFAAYARKEEIVSQRLRLLDEKKHLEIVIDTIQKEIAALEQSIAELLVHLEERSALEKAQLVMAQTKQALAERTGRIMKITAMQAALKQDEHTLELLRKEYKKGELAWRKARHHREEVEGAYLAEQAGILAQSLQEGEACPVCGATEHPHKAMLSLTAPTEKDWKASKNQEETAYTALQKLAAKGKELSGRCGMQKEAILKACTEEFATEETVPTVLNEIKKEGMALGQAEKENQEKMAALARLEEQAETKRKQLEKKKAELESVKERLKKSAEKNSLFQGELSALEERLEKNITAEDAKKAIDTLQRYIDGAEKEYKRVVTAYNEKKEEVERLKTRLEEGQNLARQGKKRVTTALEAVQSVLKEKGFASEEEYRLLLPQSREALEREEEEIQLFFRKMSQLENFVQHFQEEKETLVKTDIEKLTAEKNAAAVQINGLDDRLGTLSGTLAMKERALQQGKEELKQRQRLEQEYLPILELSKTANGELSGRDKITFESFVQGFYFDRVLRAANMRLSEMTEGRYRLLRAENASDKRSQSGLEMEVLDYYTGKSRSVKSLSGGEAFQASLSLALGLSDVIQSYAGGVQIDAMFIDEGFGALDEHSREQAVRVLQKLSYGSRLVGIISHITELKENIEKKIVVGHSPMGSTVEVFA